MSTFITTIKTATSDAKSSILNSISDGFDDKILTPLIERIKRIILDENLGENIIEFWMNNSEHLIKQVNKIQEANHEVIRGLIEGMLRSSSSEIGQCLDDLRLNVERIQNDTTHVDLNDDLGRSLILDNIKKIKMISSSIKKEISWYMRLLRITSGVSKTNLRTLMMGFYKDKTGYFSDSFEMTPESIKFINLKEGTNLSIHQSDSNNLISCEFNIKDTSTKIIQDTMKSIGIKSMINIFIRNIIDLIGLGLLFYSLFDDRAFLIVLGMSCLTYVCYKIHSQCKSLWIFVEYTIRDCHESISAISYKSIKRQRSPTDVF